MPTKQRVAVVMGGGANIGRAVCCKLAERGFALAICDISRQRAEDCQRSLKTNDAGSLVIAVDATDKTQVDGARDRVAEAFGRTDVLVNLQGNVQNELLLKLTDDAWRKTLAIHLDGTLNAMQAFAPMMIERSYGRIINMSSIAARGSVAGASYGAAKGAIEGLTRSAAMEWARYGITVNCVAPGLINAGMFLTVPERYRQAGIERTPMKRAGEPEEVAACVDFLGSADASFITGQTIFVCGGLSIGF